jgi:hypothetical protein
MKDETFAKLPWHLFGAIFNALDGDTLKIQTNQFNIHTTINDSIIATTALPSSENPYLAKATSDWRWLNGYLRRKFILVNGGEAWLEDDLFPNFTAEQL